MIFDTPTIIWSPIICLASLKPFQIDLFQNPILFFKYLSPLLSHRNGFVCKMCKIVICPELLYRYVVIDKDFKICSIADIAKIMLRIEIGLRKLKIQFCATFLEGWEWFSETCVVALYRRISSGSPG